MGYYLLLLLVITLLCSRLTALPYHSLLSVVFPADWDLEMLLIHQQLRKLRSWRGVLSLQYHYSHSHSNTQFIFQ